MRKEMVFFFFILLCCFQSYKAKDIKEIEWENYGELLGEDSESNNNVTGACITDEECFGGECIIENGVGRCKCVKGMIGEKCQQIEECVRNQTMCGGEECAFNFDKKKAFCRCKFRGQRFDAATKTCVDQKPCKNRKQCKNEGYCAKNAQFEKRIEVPGKEDLQFCQCPLGTSGDFCEVAEGCVQNPDYCGNGTDVECRLNPQIDKIYCQCLDANQRFDLKEKKCVDRRECQADDECYPFGVCANKCQTFEPCISHQDRENKYSCHCLEGTSGHNCEIVEDCFNKVVDCGDDDNVTCGYNYNQHLYAYAYCKCKDDNLQFDDKDKLCKVCDCGALGNSCHYKEGNKICTCKERSYNTGDSCEDCKCGDGSTGCTFVDGKKQCFCNQGYLQFNNTCERCDCGPSSTDCKFDENGEKICSCKPGYVVGNYGVCTPICNDKNKCANGGRCLQNICVCLAGTGGHFCEKVYDCDDKLCGEKDDVLCFYDTKKERAYCQCRITDKVFDPVDKECKTCDCGETPYGYSLGSCKILLGQKVCHCKKGYSFNPVSGKCEDCDCDSGNCTFNAIGQKVCTCAKGFVSFEGYCRECDCGINGVCRYLKPPGGNFIKKCTCDEGYNELNGKCIKCDCSPNGKCVQGGFMIIDFSKCICNEGYQESSGTCKPCDCGLYSKGCSFRGTTKVCECPRGFKEDKGYCQDIDECLEKSVCTGPGTECINTVGSFKCRCQPGYLARNSSEKDSLSLCRKEEKEMPDYKPWKIGYGILSAGFIAIIIGLVIVILKIRK